MAIPTSKLWFIAAAAIALIAALLAPFEPLYDPWAWLVWGEELTDLELDTEAGPSWKPLTALIAAPLSLLGDAAPGAWLTIARAGWLAAVALAALLAWRLALPGGMHGALAGVVAAARVRRARIAAAAIAAAGVVLLSDPFTPWSRQFAGGLSEPLLVALVLGAAERELAGRSGQGLALGFAAALLRPEAWPLLAVYAYATWRAQPRLRRRIAVGAAALPALWLVPDLLGSGSPFTGADRAREGSGSPPYEAVEAVEAIGRALELPLAALWPPAAWVALRARRDRERPLEMLAATALAWMAIVAVLAAAGYAGLPRFAAPAGAIACVLGAVGIVRLFALADRRPVLEGRVAHAAAILAVAALFAQGAVRAGGIPGELDAAADYGRGVHELEEVVEQAGPPPDCEDVTTADFYTQTALAWRLDRALDEVAIRIRTAPELGALFIDADADPALRRATAAEGVPLGAAGRWRAFAIGCGQDGS